jgi:prepilin-type N-terminal cleavage/methylation domain-containing protein
MPFVRRRGAAPSTRAVTLIELLCVMAIIAILFSLVAPVAFKALKKARRLSGEIEGPAFVEEIQRKYSRYRLANTAHPVLDRREFAKVCELSFKARRWLESSEVTFTPFSGASPGEFVVISHEYRMVTGGRQVNVYRVLDLLPPPPE